MPRGPVLHLGLLNLPHIPTVGGRVAARVPQPSIFRLRDLTLPSLVKSGTAVGKSRSGEGGAEIGETDFPISIPRFCLPPFSNKPSSGQSRDSVQSFISPSRISPISRFPILCKPEQMAERI